MADPDDSTARRFAVLHHTGVETPHYDLMFETSESSQLTTFRLPTWPVFESVAVKKLRDHRRAYLDYAGPVPGDRGRVDRVDEGRVVVQRSDDGWILRHPDGRLLIRLQPTGTGADDPWLASISDPADRARA